MRAPADRRLGPAGSLDRFPTLDHVWLGAALTVVLVRALGWPLAPSDFWWQLAYGRWIMDHGAIPAVDHFSFTRAGEPYVDQPWLSQVIMYAIYRLGGPGLSLVALATLLALTYGLVLRLCVERSGDVRLSAGLLLVSLPVAMTNWSLRSQTFALPLFVVYLVVLDRWRRGSGRRFLWVLPAGMIVWVNLHGSFVLGGLLIALTFAVEAARRVLAGRVLAGRVAVEGSDPWAPRPSPDLRALLVWGGLAAGAVLVNPLGPGVFRYVFGLVGNPAVQGIVDEWMTPTPGTLVGKLFFAFALVVALAAAFGRGRPDPLDLLLSVAFFGLAMSGSRHVIWFALVALPLLVERVASRRAAGVAPGARQGRRGLNLALLVAFAGLTAAFLPPVKPHLPLAPALRPLVSPTTPVEMVEAIRRDPNAPVRLFHSEAVGSYLMWAAPERRVFVDARVELYPMRQLQDYRLLSAGLSADSLISVYDIDGLLLENERQGGLVAWARASRDWKVRLADGFSTYLTRQAE